jgi:hypothetical protein
MLVGTKSRLKPDALYSSTMLAGPGCSRVTAAEHGGGGSETAALLSVTAGWMLVRSSTPRVAARCAGGTVVESSPWIGQLSSGYIGIQCQLRIYTRSGSDLGRIPARVCDRGAHAQPGDREGLAVADGWLAAGVPDHRQVPGGGGGGCGWGRRRTAGEDTLQGSQADRAEISPLILEIVMYNILNRDVQQHDRRL